MKNKPKLMLIGMDSLPLEIIERHAREGSAPALLKLIKAGASGRAIPSFPVYTPTNWAVLATGAEPGTTGAPDWSSTFSGKPLHTFDSRTISCETIQDAAERQNLKTLSIMYPTSYPARGRNCTVLVPLDKGLASNELFHGKMLSLANTKQTGETVTGTFAVVSEEDLKLLHGNSAARAKAAGATEDGADISTGTVNNNQGHIKEILLNISIQSTQGTCEISLPKGALVSAKVNTWSPAALIDVPAQGGMKKATVSFKVFSRNNEWFVASSGLYDFEMLASPKKKAKALFDACGGFFEHSTFYRYLKRAKMQEPDFSFYLKESMEEMALQVDWIIRAAAFFQKAQGFDIFYLHWHFPDNVLHDYLHEADPASLNYNAQTGEKAHTVIRETIKLCDRLVAGLLRLAGPSTTVCIVSDHGNVTNHFTCNTANYLKKEGLLKVNADGSLDEANSLVTLTDRMTYKLTINLKKQGRGAVEPGDYENAQDRVIDALYAWREPTTGRRPIAFAFKKQDAPLIGMWGETSHDVTYFYNQGFSWFGPREGDLAAASTGANHGPQLPTSQTAYSSNLSFYLIRAPGVKKNFRWPEKKWGIVKLKDILPTLCHLAGIEPPRDCEGAVRYRMMK